MGPVARHLQVGAKITCAGSVLVPPANARQGAWGAGCPGDGRRAELGGHWEIRPCSEGLSYMYFIKTLPPGLQAITSPVNRLQDGLIFVLHLTRRALLQGPGSSRARSGLYSSDSG